MDMQDKRKLEVFSARLTREEQAMYERVAKQRGQTKTGLLRMWIRGADARLPEEAKR